MQAQNEVIEKIRKLNVKPENENGNDDIIIAVALGYYGHTLIDNGDEMGNFLLEAEKKIGLDFSEFKKILPLDYRQYVENAFEFYIKVLKGETEGDFLDEIISLAYKIKELKE